MTQPNPVRLSYIIRDEPVPYRHRFGINALALSKDGTLFSAGRDGVIREWRDFTENPRCYDAHTDWVNGIALAENLSTPLLISASSDCTIRLWNLSNGEHVSPLFKHQDYITAVDYSSKANVFVTAGLDKTVAFWDLHNLPSVSSSLNREASASLYSVAINEEGNLVLAGTSSKLIHVLDRRTSRFVGMLRGHTDVVKALALSHDGLTCLSGSSDCSVKHWDMRTMRCSASYNMHSDSVWCLRANHDLTEFISAGRDCTAIRTTLADGKNDSVVIAVEENPILDVVKTQDNTLWVATTSQHLHQWDLEHLPMATDLSSNSEDSGSVRSMASSHDSSDKPANGSVQPCRVLKGEPALCEYKFLSDRIHVITKDEAGNVSKYNVMSAQKVNMYGNQVDFKDIVEQEDVCQSVASWCSIDIKTGYLTLHIGEHEVLRAFACVPQEKTAEGQAGKDRSTQPPPSTDDFELVNIGVTVVQCLLAYYQEVQFRVANASSQQNLRTLTPELIRTTLVQHGLRTERVSMPVHIPVFLTVSANPPVVHRFRRDEPTQGAPFHQVRTNLPPWIHDILFEQNGKHHDASPERLRFQVGPHGDVHDLQELNEPYITCPTSLPISVVQQHVSQHVRLKRQPGENEHGDDEAGVPVILMCRGEDLRPDMDVGYVKSRLWRNKEQMRLTFRRQAQDNDASLADNSGQNPLASAD